MSIHLDDHQQYKTRKKDPSFAFYTSMFNWISGGSAAQQKCWAKSKSQPSGPGGKLLPNEACWQHMEACATGAVSSSSRTKKTYKIMPNMIHFKSELCCSNHSGHRYRLEQTGLLQCWLYVFSKVFHRGNDNRFFFFSNLNLLGIRKQFNTKNIYPVCITSFFIPSHLKVTSSTSEALKLWGLQALSLKHVST